MSWTEKVIINNSENIKMLKIKVNKIICILTGKFPMEPVRMKSKKTCALRNMSIRLTTSS